MLTLFINSLDLSGIAMGYFGGKGLPFFGTTFAGIQSTEETKARNGNIAKNVSLPNDVVVVSCRHFS